jgi:hypothetical protein
LINPDAAQGNRLIDLVIVRENSEGEDSQLGAVASPRGCRDRDP